VSKNPRTPNLPQPRTNLDVTTDQDFGGPLFPVRRIETPQNKASSKRNAGRLALTLRKDEQLVCKYLHGDSQWFVTETVTGWDDHSEPPSWLLTEVAKVTKQDMTTPQEPPVQLTMDADQAAQKSAILEWYNFDLERLIEDNKERTPNYGSEFRPLHQLQRILGEHSHFPELKQIISHGMDYRFTTELPDNVREKELEAQTQQGNHQLAVN
jgi:hypothetical protein